jgi:hypothetical protein
MLEPKERPLFDPPTDYEEDDYAWTYEQAELLKLGRFRELDIPNLVSELQDLGSEKRSALSSQYRRLLHHLLKWAHQPERRGSSWAVSIRNARAEIAGREGDSPSLAKQAPAIVAKMYPIARANAADEAGLPLSAFPVECPFTLDQLRDDTWLPE